jgi:predicted signal transduction protein with EAL and GGDEF domain
VNPAYSRVYFFTGTAYAGKSTLVKGLARKHGGIACEENYHDALLPGLDKAAAGAFAEKLRAEIEKLSFPKCGCETASFGVAQALPDESADHLTSRADAALYAAKNAGKNRVCMAEE